MNFRRMYQDEFAGFARSKVMLVLWIGLPVVMMIIRFLRPDTEGIPLVMLGAILIASIGGTLSAVLLSTTITNERNRGVYDLFLIRPVTRTDLMLAKFFASLSALLIAVILSLGVGIIVDALVGDFTVEALRSSGQSLVVIIAAISTACSVGMLFGTIFDSVAVSAILSVYLGNQLSGLIILPAILIQTLNPVYTAAAAAIVLPTIILFITIKVFERKSL